MNNHPHAIILTRGSQHWETWRKANPGIRPDLAGASLSGIDLQGMDLRSADLRGACISGSNLSRADLTGAILTEADLSGALLTDSILTGVFFTGAYLSGADLCNADLREANLSGVDLSGARLCGAVLRSPGYDASAGRQGKSSRRPTVLSFGLLRGADLRRCDLRGVDLSGARLGGANLSESLLCRANLSGADLRGANLTGADISGANLYDAGLAGARMSDANLSSADFGQARLCGAILSGALLRKTSLRGADCTGADFTDAIFLGTDLSGTVLDDSLMAGVSCRNVTIDDAASQKNLVVSRPGDPGLIIDSVETTGFLQFMLEAPAARDAVIHSITGKFVLVFGDFSENRELLDAIAGELQRRDYPPLVADIGLIVNKTYRDRLRQLIPLCRFAIGNLSVPSPFPADALAVFYDARVPLLPLVPDHQAVPAALGEFGSQISFVPPVGYAEAVTIGEEFENKILGPVELKRTQMKEILHNLEYLI
jgi:uncharacterized protein YjbI with pentapeptide repeats